MFLKRLMLYAVAASTLSGGSVFGQSSGSFPSRSVMVIVPFSAGGAIDREVRQYATKMSAIMGQPVVLDYKDGAGGTLGGAFVAKAAPDGYTLLVANASFSVYPATYKNLPFDAVKDFAPVSLLSQRTTVLIASPSFAAKNVAEYIAYAKANPGKINYATTGLGSVGHLAPAWLHGLTKTTVTFIHYKGAASQLVDLTAGRVDLASGNLLAQIPLIKAGKVRPMAIFTNKRSRLLPDLPSVVELIPEFNYTNWIGIVAPAATPAPVITTLNRALVKMTKDPELIAAFAAQDIGLVGSAPAEFAKHIKTEIDLWARVVRENGIKIGR